MGETPTNLWEISLRPRDQEAPGRGISSDECQTIFVSSRPVVDDAADYGEDGHGADENSGDQILDMLASDWGVIPQLWATPRSPRNAAQVASAIPTHPIKEGEPGT